MIRTSSEYSIKCRSAPNIGSLFVTIAGIIIDSQFSDLLWPSVRNNLRNAIYIAVKGDGYRVGGIDGDNLYPDHSNVGLHYVHLSKWLTSSSPGTCGLCRRLMSETSTPTLT